MLFKRLCGRDRSIGFVVARMVLFKLLFNPGSQSFVLS